MSLRWAMLGRCLFDRMVFVLGLEWEEWIEGEMRRGSSQGLAISRHCLMQDFADDSWCGL